MRTHGGLFARLIDPAHLERAALLMLRGKRSRPDVAWLELRRESVLSAIEARLRSGTWRPSPCTMLFVREPKPRVIARAPVEDRIVHQALAMLLDEVVLRSVSECDFACRPGYGTHRALLALLWCMRRHRHVLHLDLRCYFPSIELGILKAQLARKIRDLEFLAVLDAVLESGRGLYDKRAVRRHARMPEDWPPPGRGLPLGSSTSQLLAAHLYLQSFDHWMKRVQRVPGYVRYVDDLFVFGDERANVLGWREAIARYLQEELSLRLKCPTAPVLACSRPLDALGMRVTRAGIAPLPGLARRVTAKLHELWQSPRVDVERSVASIAGHVFFG